MPIFRRWRGGRVRDRARDIIRGIGERFRQRRDSRNYQKERQI